MIDRLPYKLTTGVTATREGLVIGNAALKDIGHLAESWPHTGTRGGQLAMLVYWTHAAKRLRYREGEPWCTSSDGAFTRDIVCREAKDRPSGVTGYIFGEPIRDNPLNRLAAILCDDAEAFRVLHWCVHNLPEDE